MARKIVYDVVIDTTDSQGSIKRVEERLQELNQTADASQREIKSLQQELKELGQTRTDQSDNINSVQSLRRAYRELIEELQRTEAGTDRFNELAQAAGEVKNQIDAAQDSVNNFNKSPFENLRNNFRSLRQRIVDLDLDGFKQDFRDLGTNFRLAGQDLIGIQKGAGIAANGLRVFRTALIATGVGTFVIAIGTLIANFETIKNSGGIIGNTFGRIGDIVQSTTTAVLKLSDALGLTNTAYQSYIDKKNESNEETKKEVGTLQELEEALFNVRKEKGLTTAAEEEAFKQKKINVDLDKQEKELQDELNKLKNAELEIIKEIQELEAFDVIGLGISVAVKEYEKLTDVQKKFFDDQVQQLVKIKQEGNIFDAALFNITPTSTEGLDFSEKQLLILNDLIDTYSKIAIEKRKLNDVDTIGIELETKLALVRETAEVKRKKAIDEAIKQKEDEFDRIERIELDRLNRRILQGLETEESASIERENIEQRTLSQKLKLYNEYERDVSAIQLQISNNLVKFEKDRLEKLKPSFKVIAIGEAENLKLVQETANERIRLFKREIDFAKQLTESKEIQLVQDINFADEKVRILEAYNLKETEQYEDAVRERQVAELEFFRFKKEQRDKDLDEALKSEDELAQKNKQVRDSILNVTTQAVGQIQGIVNAQYENEIALAGDNQEKIEQIQKEQFETNKAFNIVNTIIDTAMAIMNIWANTPNPIAAGILSGVVAAIGAAQVAVIASQQFTPGSSGAGSFTANAAGSQSLGNVSSMQPNINFAQAGSGANVQTAGGGTSQSIDFTGSISVSEINDVQNLVNVYETSSIIGNPG